MPFQKKAEHHAQMAINFEHYNFVRIHQTTTVTSSASSGITSKVWESI
jgi:hypothetical protein